MTLTQQTVKISYAICVKDETQSLKNLLDKLFSVKDECDEVVIINDFTNNDFTKQQIKRADRYISKKLVDDYATHKNLFFEICKGNYIFNIDADEIPSDTILSDIKSIIVNKPTVDLFYVPRKNFIENATDQELKEIGYHRDSEGKLNWPDHQGRIYKNIKRLKWTGCVHEKIAGCKISKTIPNPHKNYLIHTKKIEKQIKNNKRYAKIKSKNRYDNNTGIVCCYFNPCNYLSKFINFCRFIEHLNKYGVYPTTVESYTSESKYRINNITENVISVYCNSVYWQKEALLNIGIKKLLKDNYEYIMWLDTDIEFISDDWIDKIVNTTRFYGVSQIFNRSIKEESNIPQVEKMSTCHHLEGNLEIDFKKITKRIGEPGYGYCYHRDILSQNLLFDKAIVGTGDFANLLGFYLNENTKNLVKNDRFFKATHPDFIKTYTDWSEKNKQLDHGVGSANVDIKVMCHGKLKDRKYISRENIIKKHQFQPSTDLVKQNGIYKLTNDNLENDIKKYFQSRDEDFYLEPTGVSYAHKIIEAVDTKDLKFVKSNPPYSITKPSLPSLNKFKIVSKINHIVVGVKTSTNKTSLERIKTDQKILIDTSNRPSINSHTLSTNTGVYGVYLSFIILFYDELPTYCFFINTNISSNNYVGLINSSIKNTDQIHGIQPIGSTYSKILLSPHTKINNCRTIRVWWKDVLNLTYDTNFQYIKGGNFVITKSKIHQHPKTYYSSILTHMKKNPEATELYFSRAFLTIFK